MEPVTDTSPTPGDDLRQALVGGLSLIGRQLTRGEVQVVTDWLALTSNARALYGRLFVRRDRMLAEGTLSDRYAEVDSATGALDELDRAGFVWRSASHAVSTSWLLDLYDRTELAQLSKRCALSSKGRRAVLVERLVQAAPLVRGHLDRPGVRLRHRKLFRRLCRAFLGRSDGDIGAMVLHRMGTRRFADYTPSGGIGLFPDRRTLLRYEASRRWAASILRTGAIEPADQTQAMALIQTAIPSPAEVRRYRSLRYAVRVAAAAAEALERGRQYREAAGIWSLLASTEHPEAMQAARRFALCAERDGRSREAVEHLAAARTHASTTERLALERTGRRIARKHRLAWRPSPPLREPRKRTLSLPITPEPGTRPLWNGAVVEQAVADVLLHAGRTVIPSENLLWTTLFGILLRDAVFAPVAGMLPGAMQSAPLDFGLPEFATRRTALLNRALDEIRVDHGLARLQHALDHHYGEAIRGVSWERWTDHELRQILEGLGGPLVAFVLAALASGASRSGLPDLVVLTGSPIRVSGLFPGSLPKGPLFIEVKGPGDSLRDGQRVWLHRFATGGVAAEVWDIRTTPSLGSSSG